MNSLYLPKGISKNAVRFEVTRIEHEHGFNEAWLQELLFEHPDLIPLAEIDPGVSRFIPICRELALPSSGVSFHLDIFGVTPFGRPVLIECKLWRNPEARRKVGAQLLEYAGLLRRWPYSDLEAQLRNQLKWSGTNPLYHHAKSRGVEIGEAQIVDAVSRCLKLGDFDLIIAGDGIRSDMHSIAEHLEAQNMLSRLTLVELKLWSDTSGNVLVVPSISVETKPVRFRVLLTSDGHAARIEDDDAKEPDAHLSSPQAVQRRTENKQFWQKFIDGARFDHPDQLAAVHGGNNWVKVRLPAPVPWLTVFRAEDPYRIGMFLAKAAMDDPELVKELSRQAARIRKESGLEFRPDASFGTFLDIDWSDPSTESKQLQWLGENANKYVNVLRPILSTIGAA